MFDSETHSLVRQSIFINPATNWTQTIDIPISGEQQSNAYALALKDGDNLEINVSIQTQGGGPADDTGQATIPWSNVAGLNNLLHHTTSTGGGLTSDQAAQLTQVEANTNQQQQDWANYTAVTLPSLNDALNNILTGITSTIGSGVSAVTKTLGQLFSGSPLDQFTPDDLGTVCFPDTLDVNIGGGVRYGLQMQCTAFPDWIVFLGAGDTYARQSLGTLEIFRGGNVLLRQGLHTTTHSIMPLPGLPELPEEISLDLIPLDYRVVLTPAPETCWHLEALVQP